MAQLRESPQYRWVVLALLCALDFLVSYVGFSLGVMLPDMVDELELAHIQAGLLGAAYFLGLFLVSMPASIWLSRYSPRRVTLVIVAACAFLMLLQAWSSGYWVLLVGRFAFFILAVGRIQAQVLLIQQWFTPRSYAKVNSILIGVSAAGAATGVGVTPFLMDVLGGWRNVYYLAGSLLVVLTFAWLHLGRERETQVAPQPQRANPDNPVGVLVRRPVLWLIASAQIGTAMAFGSFINFWPTFAVERQGVSLGQAGALLTFFPLGGMVGAFTAGPLLGLFRRRKLLVVGAGLALPPLYLALVNVMAPGATIALFLGIGFFALVVVPPLATMPFHMGLRPREVVVGVGLFRALAPLGGGIGPLIVGGILQGGGSLFLALSVVAPLPLTMSVMGLLLPEIRRQASGSPGQGRG